MQHGEAAPEESDPARPLTPRGRLDVLKVSSVLENAGISSIPIRHSSKTRARQTAQIIASAIGSENITSEEKNLNPNDPIRGVADEISSLSGDLMIVGHLPFLGKLASFLLTGSEDAAIVAFRMGGTVCLERDERHWQVAWMVVPELIQY
ncbi:MAG TPA: phosphohistidine phosphatase SixA, partial [Candidatus Acidoferrum sp.]|nr:phosphohistidine phosphatase SixA [Candidatus Acidoferrum sp.]